MPAIDALSVPVEIGVSTRLPFQPVSKSHILHCSYDHWHPRYRSSALKSRIIPLPPAFIEYLREDGIILPPDSTSQGSEPNTRQDDDYDGWDDDSDADPSLQFLETHQQIKDAIAELGGLVAPKLNWSAPKDATWISMTKNSMECASPNDIYLLLKSSDFVTHDLEHAFDDCASDSSITTSSIPYVLVLRKWFKVNPSCEFRCFVRDSQIIAICQRDLNHFDFLFPLVPQLRDAILAYFEKTLRHSFPDQSFTFDVYLPEPYDRVRLVDINPWAQRTDPLLFSWLELLTMDVPMALLGIPDSHGRGHGRTEEAVIVSVDDTPQEEEEEEAEEIPWKPEFRLVKRDDPEAYNFVSPQYSAHKLPKDVVDAGLSGEGGMRDFADQWKRMLEGGVGMQNGDDRDEDE